MVESNGNSVQAPNNTVILVSVNAKLLTLKVLAMTSQQVAQISVVRSVVATKKPMGMLVTRHRKEFLSVILENAYHLSPKLAVELREPSVHKTRSVSIIQLTTATPLVTEPIALEYLNLSNTHLLITYKQYLIKLQLIDYLMPNSISNSLLCKFLSDLQHRNLGNELQGNKKRMIISAGKIIAVLLFLTIPITGFTQSLGKIPPADELRNSTSAAALSPEAGMQCLNSRADYEKLAQQTNVPGVMGIQELKFLITDVHHPELYFINTKRFNYHYGFFTQGLGNTILLKRFNGETYFTDRRKNIAGSIIAHDNFGSSGIYTIEFWPTDPVNVEHTALAFNLIAACMKFAQGQVAYHPAGETQEELFKSSKTDLDNLGVRSILTEELFGNVVYTSLNQGEAYGVLRIADGSSRPATIRDVVIYKNAPNDLPHVAGVITEQPQTPLSHINLKAQQDKTPNAYIKQASGNPKINNLIGKIVHFKVTSDGYEMNEASQADVDVWFEKIRPKAVTYSKKNTTIDAILPLKNLSAESALAYGVKASNVAELRKILPDNVPDGFGIPFSFYDRFMKANNLYVVADQMMAEPKFKSDPTEREHMLNDFKRRIRQAPIPNDLQSKLDAMYAHFPTDTAIRCRSSTNNEDLENFSGAGLYDSYTHRPDEGDIGKTIKQVWASLWNFRAFEERDFYRIDQNSVAMAVLVHPNTDDEIANGVAITKNIYDPSWPGYYVNVQKGENLVTNPTGGATPDEYLVSAIGPNGEFETQYIRHSNQVEKGKTILNVDQRDQLRAAMEKIQNHFAIIYRKERDPTFGMDIEFKFDKNGKLIVKQARPYAQ